jgi:hypothetical protein
MIGSFKYYFLKYRFDLILPFAWGLFLFAVLVSTAWHALVLSNSGLKQEASTYIYETIGQGPFSLNPQYLNPYTPKVLDMFYVTKGAKKDQGHHDLYLGMQHSSDLEKLSYDDFLKLDVMKDDEGHEVIWLIKPIKEDKDLVIFEAKHGFKGSMMISLPVVSMSDVRKDKYQEFLNSEAIAQLSKAKMGGADSLFEHELHKNAVIALGPKTFLSLVIGDKLFWHEHKWQKVKADNTLVAELQYDGHEFYFNVLDAAGFFQHSLKLSKINDEVFNPSSMMPENVKIYESGVVSCTIGHQRLILKNGDWILKTQHICQVLKSRASIERLINFERYGPLCVIEQIQIGKERSLVRGKIFSPLRIKEHPFEIEAPNVKMSPKMTKSRSKGVKKESV